jgi:hypothetical protein
MRRLAGGRMRPPGAAAHVRLLPAAHVPPAGAAHAPPRSLRCRPMILAVSAYDVVMAVHIMAVVIAFGWTFSIPVWYLVAAKQDPRSLPTLHKIEFTIFRYVLNPVLGVVLGAGIYLASDGHHWSEFFVQWGVAVIVILGGLAGGVLMPGSRRAEAAARRDLGSWDGTGDFAPGTEYQGIINRLNIVGSLASVLVLVTILFMTIKP